MIDAEREMWDTIVAGDASTRTLDLTRGRMVVIDLDVPTCQRCGARDAAGLWTRGGQQVCGHCADEIDAENDRECCECGIDLSVGIRFPVGESWACVNCIEFFDGSNE